MGRMKASEIFTKEDISLIKHVCKVFEGEVAKIWYVMDWESERFCKNLI